MNAFCTVGQYIKVADPSLLSVILNDGITTARGGAIMVFRPAWLVRAACLLMSLDSVQRWL